MHTVNPPLPQRQPRAPSTTEPTQPKVPTTPNNLVRSEPLGKLISAITEEVERERDLKRQKELARLRELARYD